MRLEVKVLSRGDSLWSATAWTKARAISKVVLLRGQICKGVETAGGEQICKGAVGADAFYTEAIDEALQFRFDEIVGVGVAERDDAGLVELPERVEVL